nr:reverse transcriptase domain-containing protein [Tanacetum cinerariifolium]
AFQVTADIPEIYMQEFWATAKLHHNSIHFKMDTKKSVLDLEAFREMLHISPRILSQSFAELPSEKEILDFLRFLGHSHEIRYLTDVNANKLYQPWRSFASVINKCLTGKSFGVDSFRLSQAQILWGFYQRINVDFAYLIWEDFVYQRLDGSFSEAWDRFKDLLRACPHHGFSELHQLDTFYNALNSKDQDSLNFTVGDMVKALLLDKKGQNQSPALVKVVEESCVTCGGAHSYRNCPSIDGNIYRDNIQEFVSQASAINYNHGNTSYLPSMIASTSSSGTLPSNTIANPKSDLKAITTQSEATKDTANPTNNESAEDVQPQVVQSESPILTSEPVTSPISKPVIALVFKDMSFEISFVDAMILMPQFASTLKALIRNKEMLSEMVRTSLNEHCFTVLLKKLPEKLGDPSKFLIPCDFPGMAECLALADLGASINLMPFSVWKRLSLPGLTPTCMTLELADHSISRPVGVAEDVYVKVGSFYFSANFVVVDFDADPRVPVILGRSFLKTGRALINVFECDDKLPVIIAKDLSVEEKTALITVLKSHKRAITWKLFDIKGIDPEFCTHKILMEEDFESAVQHQRRVNPKIHDVIKQESSRTSYAIAADLSEMELKKILIEKMEGNKSIQQSDEQRNLYKALVEDYEADKAILDTYGDSTILKRRREDDDQEGPSAGSNQWSKRQKEGGEHTSASTPSEKATEGAGGSTTGIEESVNATLEAEVLTRSSHSSRTSYAIAADLSEMELKKILIKKMEGNKREDDDQEGPFVGSDRGSKRQKEGGKRALASTPSETAIGSAGRTNKGFQSRQLSASESAFAEEPVQTTCQIEEPPHLVFETGADDQPIVQTSQHPEWFSQPRRPPSPDQGQQYPHNLLQPLPLIPDNRGRRVILFDHFINNNLEYLQGGALSRKYTTSVTKTKAANYRHIKWIEDLVPRAMWIQQPIDYNRHALWGVSHWGWKRQQFYRYAVNRESALDVYSKRRIIAVTELKIMEWHDYKHLDWISVRRDDDDDDDDDDKDEESFVGSDRGSKRWTEGKEPESASAPLETATKSAGRSTTVSKSRQALVSDSAFAEEPVQTTSQIEEPSHLVFETGAKDQPIVQSSQHPEWFS